MDEVLERLTERTRQVLFFDHERLRPVQETVCSYLVFEGGSRDIDCIGDLDVI